MIELIVMGIVVIAVLSVVWCHAYWFGQRDEARRQVRELEKQRVSPVGWRER